MVTTMSKIHIKYMTDQAIATLHANTKTVTEKLVENPNDSSWLKSFVQDDVYVTKKYEIEDFTLKVPESSKDRDTEIQNSIVLYEHFKDLPAFVLCDERFWNWLNFEKFYQVAFAYMPVKLGSSVFKDHWLFTKGTRRSIMFGVLSRSYFRVAMTCDDTLSDPYEYSKFVIENPERYRNLTWRAFSSEKKIVLGALKAEKQILKEYQVKQKEVNSIYPEIAKKISQLGSIMLLDVMTEKDIFDFVYKHYKLFMENKMNKKSLLNKLKDVIGL